MQKMTNFFIVNISMRKMILEVEYSKSMIYEILKIFRRITYFIPIAVKEPTFQPITVNATTPLRPSTYPQNPKICHPILVTLLKMRPHYSHSSRENATYLAAHLHQPHVREYAPRVRDTRKVGMLSLSGKKSLLLIFSSITISSVRRYVYAHVCQFASEKKEFLQKT